MSERERWIIYPLLFFALGAALRDKFSQQVHTGGLSAQHIECEELVVTSSEHPQQVFARLSSGEQRTPDGRLLARTGVLVLRDSEDKQLCGVSNNELVVRQINCEGVRVADPDDGRRTLAGLGSLAQPPEKPGGKPRRFGVLALNNEKYGKIVGNPLVEPPKGAAAKPTARAPATAAKFPSVESAPAAERPADAPPAARLPVD